MTAKTEVFNIALRLFPVYAEGMKGQPTTVTAKEYTMPNLIHISLMILAVVAVAIADVVLKRAANTDSFLQAVKSPWMLGAILLYLFQILFLTYAFVIGWKLSIVGSLQAVVYAVVVVVAGVFYFRETLSPVQIVGLILAIGGSILVSVE